MATNVRFQLQGCVHCFLYSESGFFRSLQRINFFLVFTQASLPRQAFPYCSQHFLFHIALFFSTEFTSIINTLHILYLSPKCIPERQCVSCVLESIQKVPETKASISSTPLLSIRYVPNLSMGKLLADLISNNKSVSHSAVVQN